MNFLFPLIPVFAALGVVGAKIGLLTIRSFSALMKEMAARGYSCDQVDAADLMKKWHKKPASIVLSSDPEELRAIKLAHATAFESQVRPWKLAARGGARLRRRSRPRCFFSTINQAPNKAPEPTTFAVTSRAIVPNFKMKQQNPHCDDARAAPAKVVAHL
jgi:hypothetical protein